MAGVGGIQHDLALLADVPGLSGVDLSGRQQADAAVVVAVVVPVEELAAEGACVLDGAEAVGKFRAIFHRLELTLRVGVVVGLVGPRVGLGDPEIGQGALQASPLQLAVAYCALVNGGAIVRPHVADAILHNGSVEKLKFPPVRKLKLVDIQAIREGLYMAAHDPTGTSGFVFGNFPIPVAGKTGTAQAPPGDDHSWYASFAPYGHPKVVVVVMIEHGGFGSNAAAPAAKEIYASYFNVKPTP